MIGKWNGEAAWRLVFPVQVDTAADAAFLEQRQQICDINSVLSTGLGPADALTGLKLRRAAAKAVRTAKQLGAQAAVLAPPDGMLDSESLTALMMGAQLSLLKPKRYGKKGI